MRSVSLGVREEPGCYSAGIWSHFCSTGFSSPNRSSSLVRKLLASFSMSCWNALRGDVAQEHAVRAASSGLRTSPSLFENQPPFAELLFRFFGLAP